MKQYARRDFLKALGVGLTAMTIPSCASVPESSAREAFTFVQLCDTQLGMGGYEHDLKTFTQAVQQINALKPDFVVICGDLVARANKQSVLDFNRIKKGLSAPCYCVPGNHDVFHGPHDKKLKIGKLESLKNYRQAFGEDYYSFEHKGYSFICVNTQLWKVSVEEESEKHDLWVKESLAKASKKGLPIFIVAHHPLYLKQPEEKDGYYNLPPAKRKELLALYEKHGVVAVLTGHAHKIIINDYNGIQLVTGESTSKTHGAPLGFRLWNISDTPPFKHESVPLDEIKLIQK